MSDTKTENVGMEHYRKLKAEAKELEIDGYGKMNTAALEAAITAKKGEGTPDPLETPTEHEGLTAVEAKKIEARLKYEFKIQEENRVRIQREKEHASLIAESDSLKIKIDLPKNPTELQLAKARRTLGMKKVEVKPSPETLGIEASKRGYYVFTNLRQDDAAHTVNLGGKYTVHLIPGQIHVLSAYHIKKWKQVAVYPKYERVETGVKPSQDTTGQFAQKCQRVGGTSRFMFEYLGEAPQDAPFGMVTNMKILDELKLKEEQFA